MRPFFFLFSLLVTTSAGATGDFSGHWVSTSGSVSSTVGIHGTCKGLDLVIEQAADHLTTQKYDADCGEYSSKWGPVREDLKDGQVFEEGDPVGTITEDTLMTNAQNGSVAYAYNLKLITGPHREKILKTYYGVKGFAGSIVIESDMHLATP